MNQVRYQVLTSCPKCGGTNDIIDEQFTEGGLLFEAVTKCLKCSHEDHWAQGFFGSGETNGEWYYFDKNGAMIIEQIKVRQPAPDLIQKGGSTWASLQFRS